LYCLLILRQIKSRTSFASFVFSFFIFFTAFGLKSFCTLAVFKEFFFILFGFFIFFLFTQFVKNYNRNKGALLYIDQLVIAIWIPLHLVVECLCQISINLLYHRLSGGSYLRYFLLVLLLQFVLRRTIVKSCETHNPFQ
jgi:hypothetical protein